MRLSVVIPLYNKEKYIGRCLNSLLKQDISYKDYEIIVIDDGSIDSGAQIVIELQKSNKNIVFEKQENAGPCAARNKGLKLAKGRFIYFLDADDYVVENVFEDLLNLCNNNDLDILEFNTKELPENSKLEITAEKPLVSELSIIDRITYISNNAYICEAWRYFVKKSLLIDNDIKFPEGMLYEDVIFTGSLFLKAKRMSKIKMDVHRYIVVENSILNSKDKAHNIRFIQGMIFAVEKFGDLTEKIDQTHVKSNKAKKRFKAKQQSIVFAIIIRVLKYRLFGAREFKNILNKLSALDAYPIDSKTGGIPKSKSHFISFFNNKNLMFLYLRIMKFFFN